MNFLRIIVAASLMLFSLLAKADTKTIAARERVMGVCAPVKYLAPGAQSGPGEGGTSPNSWASTYFYAFEQLDLPPPPLSSVEIITQPKHGKVVLSENSGGNEILQYIPNAGYVGRDRIEYRVVVEGHPVKLIYFVHVTKLNLDDPDLVLPQFCKENIWKINKAGVLH